MWVGATSVISQRRFRSPFIQTDPGFLINGRKRVVTQDGCPSNGEVKTEGQNSYGRFQYSFYR